MCVGLLVRDLRIRSYDFYEIGLKLWLPNATEMAFLDFSPKKTVWPNLGPKNALSSPKMGRLDNDLA